MILFIEDEEPLARVFCKTLATHGFEAEYVGNGLEGISVIERRPPEVLFVDFIMPGMNGVEFAQRARASGYAGPIVLMSGAVDIRERWLEPLFEQTAVMDFAERMVKPIRLEELVSLVERLTGRPAQRQELGEAGRPVQG